MPRYQVTAPDGRTVVLEGDSPPTDTDLDEVFASLPPSQPKAAEPGLVERGLSAVGDVISGAAKEAPLVAMRAANLPRDILSGWTSLAIDTFGGPRTQATDILRQEDEYRLRQGLERPFQPTNEEGKASALGRIAARTVPTAALATLTGGATLPVQAALQGTTSGLQTMSEGATGGEVALSAGFAGAAPFAAPALSWTLGKVGGKLKDSAIKLYGKALQPTKEATKTEAVTAIPELIKRRVSGSLKKIGGLADEQVDALGREIGKTYRQATATGAKINAAKMADALESLKVPFTEVSAAGDVVPLNPKALSAIEEVQTTLRALGSKATPVQIQKYKRVVDDLVSSSNGFTRELPRGSAKEIQKRARSIFKAELEKAAPNVEKLNPEYSFWKGVQKIVKETSRRKTGQQETVELVSSAIRGGGKGAILGGLIGGAPGMAAGGAIGPIIEQITKSPVWRTWSATHRAALADVLSGSARSLSTPEGRQVVNILALYGVKVRTTKGEATSDEAP